MDKMILLKDNGFIKKANFFYMRQLKQTTVYRNVEKTLEKVAFFFGKDNSQNQDIIVILMSD